MAGAFQSDQTRLQKDGVMRKFVFGIGLVSMATLAALLAVGCGGDDATEPGTVACSIEIYSPTGSDDFTTPPQTPADDRIDIRWDGTGAGQVRVDLLRGGLVLGTVDDEVDNASQGYAYYVIDSMVAGSGDDYQVQVTHLSQDGCSDTSPEFTILDVRACDIDLLIGYPGMRDEIPAQAGDKMSISWTPTSTTGLYDVELWQATVGDVLVAVLEDDVTFTEIEDGWTIDSFHVGSSWYYIKVQDQEISSCFAVSDVFEMRDERVCTINILYPSGTVLREEGTPLEVSWESENTSEDDGTLRLLDIELWYGEQKRIETIAEGIHPADEAWMWDAVNDYDYAGQSQSNYKFKIVVRDDPYCYGFSENFAIIPQ